jgi:peroxiredoxin
MAVGASDIVLGAPAPDFSLPATDGRTYALKDVAGEKGAVIVFICNHCPYVRAVIDRLVADARVLTGEGVGFAAICSNDAAGYPEDSFPKMREFAKRHDFQFPYLHDESQDVARAYGCARPISSATTAASSSDIAAASTKAALRRPLRARAATPRRHARHRRDRPRAGDPGPLDRLLDQMEGRTGPLAAIDDRGAALPDGALTGSRAGRFSLLLPAREKIGFAWAEGSKESSIFMPGGSAARGRWRTNRENRRNPAAERSRNPLSFRDLNENAHVEGEHGTGRLISLLSPVTGQSASEKSGAHSGPRA